MAGGRALAFKDIAVVAGRAISEMTGTGWVVGPIAKDAANARIYLVERGRRCNYAFRPYNVCSSLLGNGDGDGGGANRGGEVVGDGLLFLFLLLMLLNCEVICLIWLLCPSPGERLLTYRSPLYGCLQHGFSCLLRLFTEPEMYNDFTLSWMGCAFAESVGCSTGEAELFFVAVLDDMEVEAMDTESMEVSVALVFALAVVLLKDCCARSAAIGDMNVSSRCAFT